MKKVIFNYPLVKTSFTLFTTTNFIFDIHNTPLNEFSFVLFLFFKKNKLLCSTTNYIENENQKWKNKLVCLRTSKTLYTKDDFTDYFFARQEIYQMASRILEARLFKRKIENKIKEI